jgi:transposase
MLAALDLATGRMTYRIRTRKRWAQFLDFLKVLRARWPGERLYLVMDNYGPHKRPEVRAWCAANAIELVFLPTNASWLNWIECEFTALRYFALNGTDHRTHAEQNTAIRRLCPLAQRACSTEDSFRDQLTHPRTRLHDQRCLTRH